jgi:hypothetical protein
MDSSVATVSRQQRRRASRRKRRSAGETAVGQAYPIWVDVSGRRMFVVGYTPGGAPYGIFEDEMYADPHDLDTGSCDQPAGVTGWPGQWARPSSPARPPAWKREPASSVAISSATRRR